MTHHFHFNISLSNFCGVYIVLSFCPNRGNFLNSVFISSLLELIIVRVPIEIYASTSNNEYTKMAKDDIVLGVEMGKLEIEPVKVIKIKEENPFVPVSTQKKNIFTRSCEENIKCSCGSQKIKNLPICKKKPKKFLKEPILKLLQVNSQTCNVKEECSYICSKKIQSPAEGSDILGLCALVDNCNQLRISSGSNEQTSMGPEQNENQWWRTTLPTVMQSRESSSGINQAGTCSQQALNPPCDVTIDELASYFETLVHIPKKMSSMAEMMYI